jgi:hypothetical protein
MEMQVDITRVCSIACRYMKNPTDSAPLASTITSIKRLP